MESCADQPEGSTHVVRRRPQPGKRSTPSTRPAAAAFLLDNHVFQFLNACNRAHRHAHRQRHGAGVLRTIRTSSVRGRQHIVTFFRRFEGIDRLPRAGERRRSSSCSAAEPDGFVLVTHPGARGREGALLRREDRDHDLRSQRTYREPVRHASTAPSASSSLQARQCRSASCACGTSRNRSQRRLVARTTTPRTSTGRRTSSTAASRPCGSGCGSAGGRLRALPRARRPTTSTPWRPSARSCSPLPVRQAAGAARPGIRRLTYRAVETILVAAEASSIRPRCRPVRPARRRWSRSSGAQERPQAVSGDQADVVILDMQIGDIGGTRSAGTSGSSRSKQDAETRGSLLLLDGRRTVPRHPADVGRRAGEGHRHRAGRRADRGTSGSAEC